MKIKTYLFLFIGILFSSVTFAQITVKGTITDVEDDSPVPGVTVVIKNTTVGTITDMDGKYEIQAAIGQELEFRFIGMTTVVKKVTGPTLNVVMSSGVGLDDFVVTALGISREKKALGYATQEVKGDAMNAVKYDNVVNSLSGRVSGVKVKQSGNFGGSTNIVLRGATSLTGDNQALFVIDGVLMNNSNSNSIAQKHGHGGYDYGNAISDINPDDIESVNVLKGAAATVLYGERAANGVIMITTKKGQTKKGAKSMRITYNSNFSFGQVDKNTFPKYQTSYGAGYGPYYSIKGDHPGLSEFDFDGDGVKDLVVTFKEDASFGEKFDPNLEVYQWDALYKESPNYNKKTPWVAAKNGPITFLNTPITLTNSISLSGGTEDMTYRVSYRNLNQTGILPNSKMERDNVSLSTSYRATDKLTVSADANFSNTKTTGRNSTGYYSSPLLSFRQWGQTNVDYKSLKELYELTGEQNATWNATNYKNTAPKYFNNPYFKRFKNYQNDDRNRLFGNLAINYKLNKNLSTLLRFTLDSYSALREERLANGSNPKTIGPSTSDVSSGYARKNRRFTERNVDFIITYNRDLSENLSMNAILGTAYRTTRLTQIHSGTVGGLSVPNVFALENAPSSRSTEQDERLGVGSFYGNASFGFKQFLYLDISLRNDISSTLPADNRSYFYPGTSLSFVFSELLDVKTISFGKVRASYGVVGKGGRFATLNQVYRAKPFFTSPLSTGTTSQYNPNLKSETTVSTELGLEMYFYNRKIGFDLAYYNTTSVDQIVNVPVSVSTGFNYKWLNAGTIVNSGVELSLFLKPIDNKNFKWDVTLNWNTNRSKVTELDPGIENLQLSSYQSGVSINASVGEPYGAIKGSDYVYLGGKRVVNEAGYYETTPTHNVTIGNVVPDWNAGLSNTFSYKNWSMSLLLDMQKGGDIFSLDLYYGAQTGIYEESVYTNDLGNPVRDSVVNGGGVILDGVQEDGTKNTVRIEANNTNIGSAPSSAHIYDASYIKLRELGIYYNFPKKILDKLFFKDASLGFVASNLWLLYKNLPHSDPEAGQSSGNLQGFQSGVMPMVRTFGFNLKLTF